MDENLQQRQANSKCKLEQLSEGKYNNIMVEIILGALFRDLFPEMKRKNGSTCQKRQ